jgi:hypothetical protein
MRNCINLLVFALLVTSFAVAQPAYQEHVNISGATLFENFFKDEASTHDWIDVDNDGYWGFQVTNPFLTDQLAMDPWSTSDPNAFWVVQYRGVGSGNGLAELVDWHLLGTLSSRVPDPGVINRCVFADAGDPNTFGACGTPVDATGTPLAPDDIDIAVLDVPVVWFVQVGENGGGSPQWDAHPGDPGYGKCPIVSDEGQSNKLKRLDREDPNDPNNTITMNIDTANPNRLTIFDSPIAWAPIAIISNRGADKEYLAVTELQHLFLTGRLPSGENLAAATRDSGSGTRNGGMNSLGMDPSWARGDNLGKKNPIQEYGRLGPNHQVTNQGGSTIMEEGVQNRRLAVGYTGLIGGSRSAADQIANKYEITGIIFDDRGGSVCVRPSLQNLVHTCDPNDAWQIGSPETFATRGDPEENWKDATDPNYTGDPNIMVDPPAGANYVNNIVQSIRDFAPPPCIPCDPNNAAWICDENVTDPSDPLYCDPNEPWRVVCDPNCTNPGGGIDPNSIHRFMPGEYMARTWILLDAIDCRPPLNDPTNFVTNPTLNTAAQQYWLSNTMLIVNDYGSDTSRAAQWNRVPTREADPCWDPNPDPNDPNGCLTAAADRVYNDGSSKNYYSYFTDDPNNPNGGSIVAGASLNARNGIQGDFNNDGVRDVDDICAMMAAINDPVAYSTDPNYYTPYVVNPGSHSTTGDPVNPFIIGDMNGDGNFDADDVRYFADGLATDPVTGDLDRAAAFIAVDECWGALTGDFNFFGTVISAPFGGCYAVGDSRFDVDGGAPTAGAGPNGADGFVDATDRAYVAANFGNWADVNGAIDIDLSCDMSGDLVIDGIDLALIDLALAGTDFNGDIYPVGTGDCCIGINDLAELLGNYGTTTGATYWDGDIYPVGTGDGAVNLQDLAELIGNYGNGCP